MYTYNCLSLVGMPGAGKSTLGPDLANALAKNFIDTDTCIEQQESFKLQQLLNMHGHLGLRAIEETVIVNLTFHNQIIATGGSAIYSDTAMQHLKKFGPIIFLDVSPQELLARVNNIEDRGIARQAGQSFEDIYAERKPLYLRYADAVIDCNHKTGSYIIDEILNLTSI